MATPARPRSSAVDLDSERRQNSPGEGTYAKLKPGPGRSRESVRESQRARLHGALTQLVADHGLEGVTIRGLARTAGVSTRTFYAQYSSLEECFAATYRAIMATVAAKLTEVTDECVDWEDGVRRCVRILVDAVVSFPEAAQLVTIDAYAGGPAMVHQTSAAIAEVERRLLHGRRKMQLPVAQAIVAGIEAAVGARLLKRHEVELPRTADELADWAIRAQTSATAGSKQDRRSAGQDRRSARPPSLSLTQDDPGLLALRSIGGDRGRILAAVAKLSATSGYWGVTAVAVRREAGTSRRRFEALFDGIADAYLQAVEVLTEAATARVRSGSPPTGDWAARIDLLTRQAYAELRLSPAFVDLVFRDVLLPGRAGYACRARLIELAARWLRSEAPPSRRPPPLEAEVTMAAAWRLVQADLGPSVESRRSSSSFLAKLILRTSPAPA